MKINALDINGNIKEYDTILTYHSEEYNKHYIVYTDNAYDKDDELIDYAYDLGVRNAFIQEGGTQLESFIPDFDKFCDI